MFVFTLGLTECWRSKIDGAVFPVCPGVSGGAFDPRLHIFHNQPMKEVVADLTAFRESLARVNPKAQMILTVSPVPLMATAQPGAHVLAATTYSKAVLRVSAETMIQRFSDCHYFPSFEIITGAYNRGRYYADDLRNVVEDGVAHVMRLFMHHATTAEVIAAPAAVPNPAGESAYHEAARHFVEVECDEVALDTQAGAGAFKQTG